LSAIVFANVTKQTIWDSRETECLCSHAAKSCILNFHNEHVSEEMSELASQLNSAVGSVLELAP